MRWGCRGLGLGLMLAMGAGCTNSAFQCLDDDACAGLEDGQCEATGFCSQADQACESGRRYSTHAGMLAGACVAPGGSSSGVPATAVTTDRGMPSSSSEAALESSSTEGQTTNVLEETTSSTGAPTETSDGPSGSSTGGRPLPQYDFEDDFERADSAAVGNGWHEKTDGAFRISDGSMRRDAAETTFENNIVYRPGVLLDGIEVHTTFRFLGEEAIGFPQVHARIDEAASEAPGPSTGYVLYLPNGVLNLVRTDDGEFTELGTVTPDAPIATGTDYRFRLSIGAGVPAMLDGYLDHHDGVGWIQIAEVHNTDADPLPAGTVGLSGHSSSFGYEYEHVGWFAR